MPYVDQQRERERQAKKSRDTMLSIAAVVIPACTHPELRDECRLDLLKFLEKCFPSSTGTKPYGAGQVQAIRLIEHAILHGGRVAQAFPRGFAKTSIAARAAIWAVLYGHRRYVPIFCANEDASQNILDSIKTELAENELLVGMFQWLECFRALEGKPQRCASQHVDGELTHIVWRADKIVMPHVKGCPFGGSVLQAKALRAARGLQHTAPDGKILRPDFVILDDIQTDEDAISPAVVQKIISKVKKSVLRCGGHSTTLSAVNNCTVIAPDDAAEHFLRDPGWQSVRYKMVLSFPDRMDLWEGEYRDILTAFDRDDPSGQKQAAKRALAFYEARRDEMDRGAEVSWDWAYAWDDDDPTEVSAIQHAMNIKLMDGDEVFASECQNEPLRMTDSLILKPKDIVDKHQDIDRVPVEAQYMVAHIDVQQDVLIYAVGGFNQDYTGAVCRFGVFPEQPKPYFSTKSVDVTLRDVFGSHMTVEAAIYEGLSHLVPSLFDTQWVREDGMELTMGRVLIDSGYKRSTIELFARSYRGGQVSAARGIGIGAKNVAIDEKPWAAKPKPGEARGNQWEIRRTSDGAGLQVVFDANFWKSFVWDRWSMGVGTPSAWRVMKMHPQRVQLLADQVCAEYPTKVFGRGREVEEWQLMPGVDQNHGLDNCVGLAVAANMLGCRLPNADLGATKGRSRKRVKFGA